MTDREAINATFKVLCALAEKLTGERLSIMVHTRDGAKWMTSENHDIILEWSPLSGPPENPQDRARQSETEMA